MDELDPGHERIQAVLRRVGPAFVLLGALFMAGGLLSFFVAFGGFDPPRYFWCAFVGMPLLFIGAVLSGYGFMGRVARYQAGEVTPVVQDVFHTLVDGTRGDVETVAHAAGRGFTEGVRSAEQRVCLKCETRNTVDSRFCKGCGSPLAD